jgi:hypothetical protein
MKRFQSILCASLLTLAMSSATFAGDIYGRSGKTTTGDIYGIAKPGDIYGISDVVYDASMELLLSIVA